jgi:multiple sugar transport system permease protein
MNNTTQNAFNPLKLLSLLLLIPLGIVLFRFALVPAVDTFDLSTQNYSLLNENSPNVGGENYERLFKDERFTQAVEFSSKMIGARIFIVAVLPALAGLLIGVQGWATRGINRLLLAVVAVLLSPITMGMVWRNFVSPYEENPLGFSESLLLISPEGASRSLILLDSLLTLGASLAVISLFYIAAVRGKQFGGQPVLAGFSVWLISILVTLMGFATLFDLPQIVTAGGPGNSTVTLSLYHFNFSFRFLELGYGSALATLNMIAILILAFLVWLLLTAFNLRLRFTGLGKAFTNGSWASLGSIPLILGAGLPLVLLTQWGISLIGRNGGFDEVLDQIDRGRLIDNTINAPLFTIWFIQVPFAYLATLALGFWRPLGRIGSSILFLPLLALSFLPPEVLGVSWYLDAREAGILDELGAVQVFPWVFSAFSLILFKMYFDGAYDAYQEARARGKQAGEAFLMHVFLPSLPIVLLVGGVLSFLVNQEFYWSLISSIGRENQTISLFSALNMLSLDGQISSTTGVALYFLLYFGVPFCIFFALMHLFVLDRLALIAGKTKPIVEAPIVLQSSFIEAPQTPISTPDNLESEGSDPLIESI